MMYKLTYFHETFKRKSNLHLELISSKILVSKWISELKLDSAFNDIPEDCTNYELEILEEVNRRECKLEIAASEMIYYDVINN